MVQSVIAGMGIVPYDAPVSHVSYSFVNKNPTSGEIIIGLPPPSSGGVRTDGAGPILDNLRLSLSSAVPEPSSWALIAGFGAAGYRAQKGWDAAALRSRPGLTPRPRHSRNRGFAIYV